MLKPVTLRLWNAQNSLSIPRLPLFSILDLDSSFLTSTYIPPSTTTTPSHLMMEAQRIFGPKCGARRRMIRDDEGQSDEGDEYGFNQEIAMLETYTQRMRDEVLLVQAIVDEEQVEVVIFKGFSSCLSYGTSPDPTRSILPARAVIKNIDRLRGPFDPSNLQYIEKGLTFDALKDRLPLS